MKRNSLSQISIYYVENMLKDILVLIIKTVHEKERNTYKYQIQIYYLEILRWK